MRVRVPSVLLLVALVAGPLAGCARKTQPQAAPSASVQEAGFPVTVPATNGPVVVAAKPVRIVSLSPALTEDLYAIGAGAQVVAVDEASNYPSGVPKTAMSGFSPNLEAIAGYKPDLVVISNDIKGLVAGLKGIGIPVLLEPAAKTLDDTYAEITQIGAATGHAGAAASLIQTMRDRVKTLVAKVTKRTKPLTYFYELEQSLFTVTSRTFVGSLFTMVGMRNIADPAATNDYPQLSSEALLSANPDFIFLADTKCCNQSAATVAARPGYATIAAVLKGRVVALDDDIASRWGPRVTDLLARIVDAVAAVPATG